MSARGLTIPTIFSAVDQMSPQVGTMGRSMDQFTSRLEKAHAFSTKLMGRLTPVLSETTKQFLSYASAASVAAGIFATARFSSNAIMEYETAIKSLQAVTGVTDQKMEEFKVEIADLGRASRKSSIDITKSFETIGSMMSQYLDDPRALRQIAQAGITLSKASRMELEPSLMSLTSVMNQFKLKAEDAADVVNRLTAGEIVGALRTTEVSSYLQDFGAVAANMNVNVAESVALVEALGMQMDKTKIGVGARNILTILSAAGGLDRKARQDLTSVGVDMKFLMNTSNSLSQRLHELSKIAKDPVKMISVFGKENVTAGSVIFQQLGTYDKFLAKINQTNEAEKQAAINSRTMAEAIDQLKNRWVNYLTSSAKVGSGMETIKNLTVKITDNLERIVDIGINVIKFYVGWKLVNLALGTAIVANNIRLGIQNALTLSSTALVEGNTVAKAASVVTERAMAAAIALSTGNMVAFNAALGMTPLGWAIIGFAALAAGVYLLSKRQEALNKQYQERIKIDSVGYMDAETDRLKKLTAEYWNLGKGIKDATVAALRFEAVRLGEQRSRTEGRIAETKKQLEEEQNKLYFSDIIKGTLGMDMSQSGKRGELAEKLLSEQEIARRISAEQMRLSEFAKGQIDKGTVSAGDVAPLFKEKESKVIYRESIWGNIGQQGNKGDFRFYIKNESDSEVAVQSGKTSPKSVMPQTTSTLTLNGK